MGVSRTEGTISGLAVFDLDGTVTRRDTFVPYLRGWLRRHPRRLHCGRTALALARYLVRGRDRGRLKSDLIRATMAGASDSEVAEWSAAYVAALDETEFCPGALAAIARHRAAGDHLVLLSASVDLYVPRIAERLGFDQPICTGIAWMDGRLDGALTTPNRRGDEKRRCIALLRAQFPGVRIAAYGNSRSDLAHLAVVDHAVLVNAGRRARNAARRIGIAVDDWRNKSAGRPVQLA